MFNKPREFTLLELSLAKSMRENGYSFVEIGESLWIEGESKTTDAHRHRGRRAVDKESENSRPISDNSEETTPSKQFPQVVESPTRPVDTPPIITATTTIIGDKLEVTLPKTRVKTLDELIAECEVDTRLWKVERFTCNKWEMGYLNKEKEPGYQDLYQVKATFKAKVEEYNAHLALESTIQALRDYSPTYPSRPSVAPTTGGVLLELSLPDVHIGKLAWSPETGDEYNLSIAQERFMDAFIYLLEDAQRRHTIEKIIFPIGNDLLNCDGPHGMTTGGTPQSNDGRYIKAYQVTLGLIVGAVERLMEVAPVEVLSVPGNHDTLSAWTLTETISAWFRKSPNVTVDNSPMLRKYTRWGKCLIGFTHGDKEKPESLPLIMAQERANDWAETKTREWHLGHKHTVSTKIVGQLAEHTGVKVRVLPSLSGTDSWHHAQGYIGNTKSAEAYLWHKERGLLGVSYYNV